MSNGVPYPYPNFQGPQQRVVIVPRQAPQDGCCKSCCKGCGRVCCAPFQLIRYCLGLWPKMERKNRLIISFITFAAVTLTAGLLLAFVTYGSDKFEASPADMRPLDRKFSTSLCSHFEVAKANAPVDVYFFDKMPPIRKGFLKTYVIEVDPQQIDGRHWEMVNFYMLKGSRIQVRTDASFMAFPGVSVYLIKGSYNLGEWAGDQDCCYLKKDSVTHSIFSRWNYFDYNITETDEYYITMAVDNYGFNSGSRVTVKAKFVMQKTMYDWREATSVCANYTDGGCGVDLSYGSDQIAIMYAPGRDMSGSLVKKYKINTVCQARLLIYLPCFTIAPLVAYALWALMLWFVFPDKAPGGRQNQNKTNEPYRDNAHTVNFSDQAGLVSNQLV